MSGSTKIDEFLEDIQFQSSEKFEILKSVRKIFNDVNPQLDEEIKYGGLVFNLSNTLTGGVFVYAQHISIEFSFGAELADPDKILEGKGKKRRHIKIRQIQDIQEKKVKGFVASAMNEHKE
ncbi:hypothetical protein MNBD_GAMMA04-1530 [hydrothermal vent metagenome]|uniref:YdhG-like domain-containing protein n=1 Tax=hydrothermal vent metagenome TaxID=652676 RepID=A0A3B0WVS7_9ZZZZ